jgi:ammonia channel protein AmtB
MEDELTALSVIFTEFYYWLTVAVMFLIHVGFLLYEAGSARRKNVQHTVMKNVMLIPLVTVTFFFFGWWIYFAFPAGPGIYDGLQPASEAAPWSPIMAPHMDDRITGVFWAAFLLFSWTAASIVSGSVLERIRTAGFLVLAVLIGSVFWIIDAAWGWHPEGWMVQIMGYHDAYASGVIHAIAGGFALGGMLVWKSRRVWRRLVRPWDRRTAAGAGAAAFVAVSLLSGWAWSSGVQLSFAGYNPLSYHNGTVWPHDNSIIAAGFARYGYGLFLPEIRAELDLSVSLVGLIRGWLGCCDNAAGREDTEVRLARAEQLAEITFRQRLWRAFSLSGTSRNSVWHVLQFIVTRS